MFNRFAILNAYYMFASLCHSGQGSKEYAYFGRLDKIGYRPSLGVTSHNPDRLDEDSREVFDRLVEQHEAPAKAMAEKARIEKLRSRTFDRANHILAAAQHDASNKAKNSNDWQIRNALEDIHLHCNGYAEPGYTEPDCGIVATGNWNKITTWRNEQTFTISDVPSRIAKLFEKLGIPTEWSDEWVECSHCGKLVRSQPDSMSWKPSYTMGDGELWCHECDDTEESDDESAEA
jgi:hypothetical protein